MIASSEPFAARFVAPLLLMLVSGCTSLGAAGPTTGAVRGAQEAPYAGGAISVVDLTDITITRLAAHARAASFAEGLGDSAAIGVTLGEGDVIDIAIWEAPPAVLFGSGDVPGMANGAQSALVPQQVVDGEGTISVPFIGRLSVSGQTPDQVEREIERRLARRANNPQAVVRLVANETRNATVLGEVANSRRVPLGPGGERLLDALAMAGGSRHPLGQTSVQVSRAQVTLAMPLDAVIRDPAQNIRLRPDDVVTVLHQPFSFIALGAVQRNAEVPFEGGGLTLAQALGRIGGLRDDRADVRGVFVFRLEDPAVLDQTAAANAHLTAQGRAPVIYRLDLSDPASFFAAQGFEVRDDDVLYVSTAPVADIQRFIATLSGFAFSTIALGNAIGGNAD